MNLPIRFLAKTVTGSGRGRTIGSPTINLNLSDIPADIEEGIYAARSIIDGTIYEAAIHFGPRPVFKDDTAFEVYLLDTVLDSLPESVEVELIERLRDVLDFESPEELMKQIAEDVERTRAIL